jgi:hypothetical protein
MATTGIRWDNPPDKAWGELADAYQAAIQAGVKAIALRWAPEIENWMKGNAPWTDRTANARQKLNAAVETEAHEMVSIILSHGVDYGIYLELRNAGRYAIIGPALDEFASKVWDDVVALVS